jgi:hypothetical protein
MAVSDLPATGTAPAGSREIWKKLALLVASTVFSLYIADVLLSKWIWGRSQLQVLGELRQRGIHACPLVTPHAFIHRWPSHWRHPRWLDVAGRPTLPLAGISRALTLMCSEGRDRAIYTSDEHGFHNPPGLWDLPGVDVVAVGDSYTHGYCVGSGDNMVSRIRERYAHTLNLGFSGNGPLAMLGTVREYLPRLRARVLLWCYFSGNDLLDLRSELAHPILARYLDATFSQRLVDAQDAVDHALKTYVEQQGLPLLERKESAGQGLIDTLFLRHVRSWAVTAVRQLTGPLRDYQDFEATEQDFAAFRSVLDRAKAETSTVGTRLFFVYLPSWGEMFGHESSRELARKRRERVLGMVADLGLPMVDVREAFADHEPESLFACRVCHYSATGYELAARQVLAAVAKAHQ